MILDTRPLHVTYAEMAEKHRNMAEKHFEDAQASPQFTRVRDHNMTISALLHNLSAEYALLSGVHQELHTQAHPGGGRMN